MNDPSPQKLIPCYSVFADNEVQGFIDINIAMGKAIPFKMGRNIRIAFCLSDLNSINEDIDRIFSR